MALIKGFRGLQGNTSLARLLAEERGVRNKTMLPDYSEAEILLWADAHQRHEGEWPNRCSGPILEAPGETWQAVHLALRRGGRGLPGGTTLAILLAERRGVAHHLMRPRLRVKEILGWADAHHAESGQWPMKDSGPVRAAENENWLKIDVALRTGGRGLPGGSSLARLLAARRGVRNRKDLEALQIPRILAWADAHFERHGRWPTAKSGAVEASPGETWMGVSAALAMGIRGLPGGSSLAQLLASQRGVRNKKALPQLSLQQIVRWANGHREHTGHWPTESAGSVSGAAGEIWGNIAQALRMGLRGLPSGWTLGRLLAERCGRRNPADLPPLTEAQILKWADRYQKAKGRWPTAKAGAIDGGHGETWNAVDSALRDGVRGLTGDSSLARLLQKKRGVPNLQNLPPLTEQQIVRWARQHEARTGQWPTKTSGPVAAASGEVWGRLDVDLRRGGRGLPGGASLRRLRMRWQRPKDGTLPPPDRIDVESAR